jgi:hypothetical protein
MPSELKYKKFLVTEEESAMVDRIADRAGKSVSNMTRELWKLPPLHHGKKPKEEKKRKK